MRILDLRTAATGAGDLDAIGRIRGPRRVSSIRERTSPAPEVSVALVAAHGHDCDVMGTYPRSLRVAGRLRVRRHDRLATYLLDPDAG